MAEINSYNIRHLPLAAIVRERYGSSAKDRPSPEKTGWKARERVRGHTATTPQSTTRPIKGIDASEPFDHNRTNIRKRQEEGQSAYGRLAREHTGRLVMSVELINWWLLSDVDRWLCHLSSFVAVLLAKLRKVRPFYAQFAISYHSSDRGVVFGPTYPSADHLLRLEFELRYLLLEQGTIFPEGANSAVTVPVTKCM